jgi:pimeloyl-ACP methyl ester carboxylesterase
MRPPEARPDGARSGGTRYPFVLVHGSNDGSWVWKKLAPLLRAAGHEVYAPTLTGLADRAHLLRCGVDLSTHIADVAGLLVFEDVSDAVLVGSSYAGMVITGVAAKVPERLRRIVYLDAYVPEDGQSAVDLWPPERRGFAADAEADGVSKPPPPELFGVNDAALADWVAQRMTPHPVGTYTEPVPPGNDRSRALPRVFVQCTGNPPTTPDVFGPSAQRARAKGWEVHELAAGHLAMLTAPDDVAAILLELGARA